MSDQPRIVVDQVKVNHRTWHIYISQDGPWHEAWCHDLHVGGVAKLPDEAIAACCRAMEAEVKRRGELVGPTVGSGQGRTSSDVANAALLAGACLFAGAVGFLWMVMR